LKAVYGVGLLLIGLVVGLALGIYALYPLVSPNPAAGKNNQVQVVGEVKLPSGVSNPTITFDAIGANTTIDTTVPIGSSGQFSVILVGGLSYQISVNGGNSLGSEGYSCGSSIYVPSGVTTFTPTIAACG
jgi:hypothetical protein